MSPIEAMQLAIDEAKKGAGFVSPNPLVGCVILDGNGNLLSSGYHHRVGEAHAEIDALKGIKDQAKLKGAHVYVTLEPCAHQGRTPPCAEALAKLPLSSLTYGLQDPNPQVSGKGAARVAAAGIRVEQLRGLDGELEDLAEVFLTNHRLHRPFVAMKVGSSLDGQMAMQNGESQWITSEPSRAFVQTLRGCYDGVLVGVNTFLKDNPRLNSRDPRFAEKVLKAVIVDPNGRSFAKLASSNLLQIHEAKDVVVVTKKGVKPPRDLPICHWEAESTHEGLDWSSILNGLMSNGLASVFVEGGAFVFSGLLNANLVDRMYVFLAPKLLGGGSGVAWTKSLEIKSLAQAPVLSRVHSQSFGPDILITGRLQNSSQS